MNTKMSYFKPRLLFVASISFLLITNTACADGVANKQTQNQPKLETKIVKQTDATQALITEAEAGNVLSQMSLGFKYLNYGKDSDSDVHYGCYQSKESICQTRNEEKGFYWLKKAAESFDTRPEANFELFASQMCYYLRETANGNKASLKQAYLWGAMAVNEKALTEGSNCLNQMYEHGELKLASPQVNDVWSNEKKRSTILYQGKSAELPDWIVEIRKNLAHKDMPVFTYWAPTLEVYGDGRVFLRNKENAAMKVTPKHVQKFLDELKKLGFFEWTKAGTQPSMCSKMRCMEVGIKITTRLNQEVHRLQFVENYEFMESYLKDNRFSPTLELRRMALLKDLVERYFPTRQYKCNYGIAEQDAFCNKLENTWKSVFIKMEK